MAKERYDIFPKNKAYWIDPRGTIIPVPLRHINMISADPKKFGVTKEYIDNLYKKHKERPGQEGKARGEIMTTIMKNGWIRLRYIPNAGWTVQLNKLGKREKDYLFDFAYNSTNGKLSKVSPETPIIIMDYKGNVLERGALKNVLSFELFECVQEYKLNYMLIEDYKGVGTSYLTFNDFLKDNK
jgi:hypothetical protein